MALSDFVEEECRSAMIFDDMDITCLTVFAKQIEESKLKKYGVREKKRSRLVGDNDKRVSKSRPQGKCSESLWTICSRCSNRH